MNLLGHRLDRGVLRPTPDRTARRQSAGASHHDRMDDNLGGDLQAETGCVEHHVKVVRIVRVDPVHGAVELGSAAIEVFGGPPGGADGNAHSLRPRAAGPDLERGDSA